MSHWGVMWMNLQKLVLLTVGSEWWQFWRYDEISRIVQYQLFQAYRSSGVKIEKGQMFISGYLLFQFGQIGLVGG